MNEFEPGGVLPVYLPEDDIETRIARCIQFELLRGGNAAACARAILRDMTLGHITIDQAADRAAREECAGICKGIKETHWDSERGYGAELCEEEIMETINGQS